MLKKILFCLWIAGVVILTAAVTHASDLTLAWDLNPDPQVAGYRLYCGTTSGVYSMILDAGLQGTALMTGLKSNTTYYFAVTAYDASQNESDFSREVVYQCKFGSENRLQVILMLLEDE